MKRIWANRSGEAWIETEGNAVYLCARRRLNLDSALPPAPIEPTMAMTGRQKQVYLLMLQNKTAKEIAVALDIAVRTAKLHITTVYALTGCTTRGEFLFRHLRQIGV